MARGASNKSARTTSAAAKHKSSQRSALKNAAARGNTAPKSEAATFLGIPSHLIVGPFVIILGIAGFITSAPITGLSFLCVGAGALFLGNDVAQWKAFPAWRRVLAMSLIGIAAALLILQLFGVIK